jgi:hypothetical protein
MRILGLMAVVVWGAGGASAQTAVSLPPGSPAATGALPRVTTAVRASADVVIDGRDDEAVWRTAPVTGGFRQFDPELDADPSHPTEFRVAYDEDNLYVFVRALDASPDSILRALTRRDVRGPSDQIGVMIDSYHDRRTGFAFWVNPDGVQRDFAFSNDTNQDQSWNGVWDVATAVGAEGWTAEFRIPLSQLRYASADRHTFGFGIRRQIDRYPESSSWPHYDRNNTGMMSQLGTLQGLEGLGRSNRLEVTPYAVTKNVTRTRASGGLEHPQEFSAGADVKLGITPNLTLDATVNPDFGQVEADPAQVNLSAFATFSGERRPFFLEGTGLYRFQLNCYIVVDCNSNEGLFYSRRIGRSPALRNQFGDALTPNATPIAAAAKLTGRQSSGLSFGILDAVTQHVEGVSNQTVEPRTNYAVVRAQQDLRNGESSIGFIGTSVNRANDALTAPQLHESAYVTGLNARNRFSNRRYEVAAFFAASRVAGSAEAMARTQTASAHYYQQPGDDPAVDSSRTSLTGYSAQLKFGKYGGGITRFETSFVYQSPGFEVNDLGYLRRADIYDWSTWGQLSFQSPTSLYRWASFNANTWYHWNTSGDRIETSINLNGHMGLHNNWDIHGGGTVSRLGGAFCDRCTRGGPLLRRDVGFFPWFGFNADSRRTIQPGMWVNLGFWDAGRSRNMSLGPYLNFRISSRFTVNVGSNFFRADDDAQWIGNFTDAGGVRHHAFAHLDQRTVSFNLRVNYTVTPDLTFELYGEPFASSGVYTDMREVSATPDAWSYDARFQPYAPPAGTETSFSFRQIRTNAVLRWEYLPGSTLFLVWAHGRDESTENQPRRAWQSDLTGLLDLDADHTFLLKVSYWLNR